MVANGRLSAAQLYPIQSGLYLSVKTGRAFKRLQAAAKKQHRTITAARVAGAYRSLAVQRAIRDAFDSGDPRKRLEWNLDPMSTIRPADPGFSNHGLGISVDIVGTDIDPEFKALCKRYGFTFPYGDRDPRHAVHDGKTATLPIIAPSKKPKKVFVVVRRNDTLSGIASRYRQTVRQLLILNPQIEDANRIYVGQKVRVA
jgi:nucleoid-associated protein YgaU